MKNHTELTNEELLALTPEEVATLIDFECAVAGVPLLPALPLAPVKKFFDKDLTVYKVGSFNFTSHSRALEVVELLNTCELIDTNGWGSNERACELTDYNAPKVETKKIYSKDFYAQIESTLQEFEKQENEYNELKREYDRILKLRKDIADVIDEKIEELQRTENRKQELIAMFDRYVTLADGDKRIALKFLNNAQSDAINFPDVQKLGDE